MDCCCLNVDCMYDSLLCVCVWFVIDCVVLHVVMFSLSVCVCANVNVCVVCGLLCERVSFCVLYVCDRVCLLLHRGCVVCLRTAV